MNDYHAFTSTTGGGGGGVGCGTGCLPGILFCLVILYIIG